ncbi:hypothetical protein K504DRAFT_212927 [Pleomassaria siparia CBS 279.74]|uniref:Uncharacterized protein n=1 Tax=Pleomassaria siparia CBS 279.74 TaxID=1314801 RepID=A0A6G1JQ52_9PLEO|nr:hypothetical protein K504DRAFT_212927 [Pleomassaria siparia CBS 279.74]
MTSLARLLSPSPPPLKKLKSNPFMPHMHPGQNHAPIFAAISVHKKDMGVTHYEIPQPHESLAYSSPSFTDSETEADTDTEASDGENKLSGRMFVLVRNPCTASCCVSPVKGSPFPDGGTSLRDLNLGEPPRSIGWKDVKSAPDACPLCRKVLFKKAGPKRKQRFGD